MELISQGIATNWQDINVLQVIWDAGIAGIGGALSMSQLGWGVMIAANTALGFISSIGSHLIQGTIKVVQGKNFWKGFADGAADGAMWGGIFSLVSAGIGAIKYTRCYRVVGLNEYEDIVRSGKFATKGFAEGKYFWSSKSSAKAFASEMKMADNTYKIIGSRISRFG